MKFYRNILKLTTLVAITAVLLGPQTAMAFSLLEWLGFGSDEEQTEPQSKASTTTETANWAETSSEPVIAETKNKPVPPVPANSDAVKFEDIKLIIANLSEEQRRKLLSDGSAFSNFLQQQAMNQSVLNAARANKLEEDPFTRLLMQKSAENTLREIYINRLINKELPVDFPTEEQSKTFYDNNQDKFTLEERVHVWQIFLPFGKDADTKTKEKIKKQATDLKNSIESKKMSFANAATEFSQHIPSRHAGGYMGLIKLSDIKPEIRETVLNLKEGQLSNPVQTEDGYHLIMRGNKIDATVLPYAQVKARINQALRKEAGNRLRRAIFEQANKTYGQDLDNKRIEEWRLKLRTNL